MRFPHFNGTMYQTFHKNFGKRGYVRSLRQDIRKQGKKYVLAVGDGSIIVKSSLDGAIAFAGNGSDGGSSQERGLTVAGGG